MSAEKPTVYSTLEQTQDNNVSCARCEKPLHGDLPLIGNCQCKRPKRNTTQPSKLRLETGPNRIDSGISKSKPERNPNKRNKPVSLNPGNFVEGKFCNFLSVHFLDETELQMANIAAIAAIAAELASVSMPCTCPLHSSNGDEYEIEALLLSLP